VRPLSFQRHQFPADVIRHAVWLYMGFTLGFRDVEEMLAARGIDVSGETIRCWTIKFGPQIARNLNRDRPAPSPLCPQMKWSATSAVSGCISGGLSAMM
jgi:transposase-like protein